MHQSSFFHIISVILAFVAFITALYLIMIKCTDSLYVIVFISATLITTNIGLYYLSINQ